MLQSFLIFFIILFFSTCIKYETQFSDSILNCTFDLHTVTECYEISVNEMKHLGESKEVQHGFRNILSYFDAIILL